ncbi:MAG: hypothetical protein GEU90_05180 [Gemmatimonas sp.]|nr:hypothetical protein [Gemmatimonas sp.]
MISRLLTRHRPDLLSRSEGRGSGQEGRIAAKNEAAPQLDDTFRGPLLLAGVGGTILAIVGISRGAGELHWKRCAADSRPPIA